MRAIDALQLIRPKWLVRANNQLARGESVREGFEDELSRFYDLLYQSICSGDPTKLDSILSDWVNARTQTSIEDPGNSLTTILNRILQLGYDAAVEDLSAEDALCVMGAVLPVFEHGVEYLTEKEMATRIQQVSSQLENIRDRLERLDKSKSDFIAIAAHELKTPLTLIAGYTSMLRQGLDDSKNDAEYELLLGGIDKGAKRLKEIIDDMIDVSLIDNNLLLLNFQPVWIGRIFEQVLDEYQPTLRERALKTRLIEFPGGNEMTFGDEERLLQAFRNIISNSIKFTPNGGSITIDGRKLSGFVEITISDTGIGIDVKDQTKIFEKFGQLGKVSLHSSGKTKFKGGGPGLGLPITKGIIEAHRGAIWVESEGYDEEKCPGSVFHVLLPVIKEPPDDRSARLFGLLSKGEHTPDVRSGLKGNQR